MLFRWRWTFPQTWLSSFLPVSIPARVRSLSAAFLNTSLPDDCRICNSPLTDLGRVPICAKCLQEPEIFVPQYFCCSCGTSFLNERPLDEEGRCRLCREGLVSYDAVYSFGEYEGRLRKLIHLYKFDGMIPLAEPLSRWALRVVPRDQRFDVIVPTPLHWTRRFSRGFNQAEILASKVSRRLKAPMVRALSRSRRTANQSDLTRAKRRLNVAGVFVLRSKASVVDRHVLLVDDIFTTGATASACAHALKRAGAKRVSVLTVARADRRKSTLNPWELT
jgi:ComF family protein